VLQRHEATICVDRDADRVEAQLRRARALMALLQPRGSHSPQTPALCLTQPVERSAGTDSPGLHLAEDDALIVRGDQVDLAPARAVVALHDRKAAPLEMLGGQLLSDASEAMAQVVRHVPER